MNVIYGMIVNNYDYFSFVYGSDRPKPFDLFVQNYCALNAGDWQAPYQARLYNDQFHPEKITWAVCKADDEHVAIGVRVITKNFRIDQDATRTAYEEMLETIPQPMSKLFVGHQDYLYLNSVLI